jgi:hypothetical protein
LVAAAVRLAKGITKMAELNFNALARPGPKGFYQGFEQGQEQRRTQENQLAEQQMKQQANMQAQQFNALKMQGYQEDRAAKSRAEKAALFRDSILRAPDPNTAREAIKRQYADPDLGPLLQQTLPLDAALSEISDDIEQFRQYQQREALGLEGYAKSQMPKVAGNAVYDPRTNSFLTAPREPTPVAPSAPVAVMGPDGRPQFVTREQAIGMTPFSPAAVKFVGGGAAAGGGRAAPAAKAPPGYRFTPTGDLEAIPGGPAAAKLGETAAKKDEGITQASNILDSLEAAYTDLEARKAIPSEKRNAVANTLASISASAPGQIAERTIGTKAQTQRDVIASSRLQLLNAIKGATGMSSQQLNSNVELTTWLNSLTDPSRSIETNREILQNVRRFIDSGGTYSAKQGGKTAPAAGASDITQERANANAAIAAGAPAAAVRQRFKQNTGQEL